MISLTGQKRKNVFSFTNPRFYANQKTVFRVIRRFVLCLSALLLFVAQPSVRSEDTDSDKSLIEQELDWLRAEAVEITVASKLPESAFDAPSSVTVITAQQIQDMGFTNVQELLNFVPGFQAMRNTESAELHALSVRGRRIGFEARDILIMLDGQRLNEVNGGSATFGNTLLAVENIKQVEIIRGPGSALYGSNAFLGVINIVTDRQKRDVFIRGGGFAGDDLDIKEIGANYSQEIGDFYVSGFAKGFSDRGDTFRDVVDAFGQTDDKTRDPNEGVDLFTVLGYKDLELILRYTRRDYEDFFFTGGLGDGINNNKIKNSFARISYKPELGENLTLDVNGGYSLEEWDGKGIIFPAGFSPVPGLVLQNSVIAGPLLDTFYADIALDMSYRFNETNTINAGIGFANEGVDDSAIQSTHNLATLEFGGGGLQKFKGADSFFIRDEDRDIFSVYIQHRMVIENFTLTAGARFDDYSDFGSTINPRGALVYATPWTSKLKLMYGEAFRAPTFTELFLRNNPLIRGNPDLDPEEIATFEVAYLQQLGNNEASITYFRNKIKDIITEVPIEDGSGIEANRVENQGENTTDGLELDVNVSVLEGLNLRGTFSYIFSGEDQFSPREFGSLIANYRWSRLNCNINATYYGDIESLPNQDAFIITNAAVRYELTSNLSLQLVGNNIFDKHYLASGDIFQTPSRGRSFFAEVKYTF